MAKFFLSHSAGEGSTAQSLLEALVTTLGQEGHDPFEAARIHAGERWRGRIYDELAICDAAVVLMDRAALTSWWVHREVSNLLWRKHLGSVEIRVVLLDGVTPGDIRAHRYGELVELQFLGATDCAPAEVAAKVVASFGAMPDEPDDNMRTWIEDVTSQLGAAPVGLALRSFARHVGLERSEAKGLSAPGCYRFLAHQLLGRPRPDDTFLAVDSVRYAIGPDRTAQLAELSAPALVDGVAAHVLLRPYASGPRIYLLNARSTATAALYVSRAACCARTHRIAGVSARTGEEGVAELEQRCEAALARMLHLNPSRYRGQRLYEAISRIEPGPGGMVEACYLAIDLAECPPGPVTEVISRLHARIPWLIVIILSTSPGKVTAALDGEEPVLLEPTLSEGEEEAMDRVVQAFQELGGRVGVHDG
ncbi:toll/interleukin-1 receptor domain-containing protein [Actinoplanes subglobosus]|uniref:Toll/interleukin-1 receptor domain-containing protein n=1 Tax=Actinoplanes subglobosus TaxID=1547892 RepID=A0ABV8J039_9ACTN